MAVLKVKAVSASLRKHKGNMAAVARSFGVTRQAVTNYVAERPDLKSITVEMRESRIDGAESQLDKAVAKGQAWAISLMLRTQGRSRGYGDHIDVSGIEDMTNEELLAIVRGRTSKGGS
jgi:predicted transcriptional regulator